jgi:tyrosyl-tRNA synthetase
MSKSYGNYIGLTDAPDDMFGKVMSVPDSLMVRYYRLCTGLEIDEIDHIEQQLDAGSLHPNEAKRRLARDIVELYHGAGAAAEAEAAFDRVFKHHEVPDEIPEFKVSLADDVYLPGLLNDMGLVSSAGEGRRMIDGGAVRIDGEPVAGGIYNLSRASVEGRVVQVGKRRYGRPVS